MATEARVRGQPVLIYDGDCGFCQAAVSFARRRIHPALRAQAFQETDLDALGLTEQRAARELLWVGPDGQVSGGSQAVARLLIDAGGPWAILGVPVRVPPLRWLAQLFYRLIAVNRHRLPGGTPLCGVDSRHISAPDRPASASDSDKPVR